MPGDPLLELAQPFSKLSKNSEVSLRFEDTLLLQPFVCVCLHVHWNSDLSGILESRPSLTPKLHAQERNVNFLLLLLEDSTGDVFVKFESTGDIFSFRQEAAWPFSAACVKEDSD